MNIEKGKKIFFKYNGSMFHIERDLGNEYKKFSIPKEIEEEWKIELINRLHKDVNNKSGNYRVDAIGSLIQILPLEEATRFLISVLNGIEMDTFSKIIVCESLKQLVNRNSENILRSDALEILLVMKKKMLNQNIIIDESFRKLQYLSNYDFSDENIIDRINKL